MPRSKRYQKFKKLVDPNKVFNPDEAFALVKKTAKSGFDTSIEAHVNLGIDVRKGEQQVRSITNLPHGSGKTKRIVAFVSDDKEAEAKSAGADIVGGDELIQQIAQTNKVDFDVAIASPDMMSKLAKIAKILGPSGLMPNPKTDTVGPNIKKMIEELKKGKVAFKNDLTGNVHQIIGKASMSEQMLKENFFALTEAIKKAKPASSKGVYLKSITITSTMGPGIRIDTSSV